MTETDWIEERHCHDRWTESAGASAAKALTGNGLKTAIAEKAKLCRYKMYGGIHTPTSRTFLAEHFPDTIISTPRETIGTPFYTAFEGNIAEFLNAFLLPP